jgi:type II restriction/modification system DNA methylase subunit YeeA
MNTSSLKAYAPQARTEFIRAVTDCAGRIGLSKTSTEPITVEGDVAIIGGVAHPKYIVKQRSRLEERIAREGFDHVMEAVAYTWFNRFAAIRYMEIHGYLDHGYRVLSHPTGNEQPEILEHAAEVDLPGLDRNRVVELKLDGTKDEELYRLLILAQCNALHQAMPFLFEEIGDADELLLPTNLLHTDSLIRQLVEQIDEDLWEDIEIIGWLYQFYISEKKDQVIGKVVKSEDIPAATQLFTPNWIVKYMVQNSLGAQWLATYPDSKLKEQIEYYIEPAEQTDEVNAQIVATTPSQLNPEELTLIDPASGSGHILVEAYEFFKAIYLERGYRQRDVAQLILEKNLFGLDIDGRAAQLTGFALMMKGRADDRRLFDRGVNLNVMALVDSAGFDADRLAQGVKLAEYGLQPSDLKVLKALFEHATTFGSLIQVREGLAKRLPAMKQLSEATSQDLFVSEALKRLGPLVQQAELLSSQYDAVVANPPYMGSGGMNGPLKKFAKHNYPESKSDLFACFIERGCMLAKDAGNNAMITMHSWMFLSSFEKMRERILREKTIRIMAHLGARAFGSISGEVVQTTAFVLGNRPLQGFKPVFHGLLDGGENEKRAALVDGQNRSDATAQDEFKNIPGSPLAYWASPRLIGAFARFAPLSDFVDTRIGLITGDNERYIRNWSEVDSLAIGLAVESREIAAKSSQKWFPQSKGGDYRKWFGNNATVLDWSNDGHELQTRPHSSGERILAHNFNLDRVFEEAVTWTKISGEFGPRHQPQGYLFNDASSNAFLITIDIYFCLSLLCAVTTQPFLAALNPTLNYLPGTIGSVPTPTDNILMTAARHTGKSAMQMARLDWDAYERSWDFESLPLLAASTDPTPTLESSYTAWITQNRDTIAEMKRLEEENNRLFIDAYGLADELTPDVPIEQITLTVNPAYRYGGKLTEEEQWTRFRQDTMEELVSYAIGCMMGRYSLDEPGLIYAHSGNEGFDHSRYATFGADDDGIVPLTDTEWFDDDAANRVIEFISKAWPAEHLEANLTFLADNLSPKNNESSRETIRRYLNDKFFKDHLQTYKKRPIYWLFSSGKQKAFQCLVYLHRYNEGTLARIRTEYAIPLQGKLLAQIDRLEDEISAATSTSQSKKLEKQRDKIKKQREELRQFDEKLRHYADKRITLDLDDGVKVNYGKFGDLLAEVKAVHGKKAEA